MTTVAQKHPIFGWLKQPRDLEVDGKVISEVVRITGDSRWGFLYEFRKDGNYQQNEYCLYLNSGLVKIFTLKIFQKR